MSLNTLRFFKTFVLVMAVLLPVGFAEAANWYVRPSSAGSGTAADWNNASSITSINWGSVKAGDTIWMAGGNYSSGLTIGASGSSGSPINIYRVRSTDSAPAAAAGWSSAFDAQVVMPPGIENSKYSYVNVSGRIASGILINIPSSGGDASHCADGGNVSNFNCSYIQVVGPNNATSSTPPYGFNWAPGSNTITNCTIDHAIIGPICNSFRCSNWSGVTIQNCVVHDLQTDPNGDHNDTIFMYTSNNVIFRYNIVYNSPDDGIFNAYGGCSNLYIYGNIFFQAQSHIIFFDGGSTGTGGTYGPVFIYNNVFEGPSGLGGYSAFIGQNPATSFGGSSFIYNNIFANALNNLSGTSGITSDYNAYYPAITNGYGPPSEPHSVTLTSNPFVNLPGNAYPYSGAYDFHLVSDSASSLSGGKALTADGFINQDMDGNVRGTGGIWYIGAYQYGGSAATPTPTPQTPTGMKVTAR